MDDSLAGKIIERDRVAIAAPGRLRDDSRRRRFLSTRPSERGGNNLLASWYLAETHYAFSPLLPPGKDAQDENEDHTCRQSTCEDNSLPAGSQNNFALPGFLGRIRSLL
jgi:hypothetical protein